MTVWLASCDWSDKIATLYDDNMHSTFAHNHCAFTYPFPLLNYAYKITKRTATQIIYLITLEQNHMTDNVTVC